MNNENDAVRDSKQKSEVIPLLFDDAEIVMGISKNLIKNYHSHLSAAEIRYIFRNRAAKRSGVKVSGNVYKMSGKYKFLTGFDFIVEIALDVWNDLAPNQRIALVDHLLTRCVCIENETTGDFKWKVIPPAIQEFPEVAERNGQWNEGLVDMEKALRIKM
ncbi:MAG TPA: hypothetical protein ENI61_02075 [Ignavibacteria bacterium]|nr:hypothetical protein [Ignavibacteria bacterium]